MKPLSNPMPFSASRIEELLEELNTRLPELEWKMSGLSTLILNHKIPKGLFRCSMELTSTACIEEIKKDIQTLSGHKHQEIAHYLAGKILQKVNVLVAVCHLENKKIKKEVKPAFGIKMLSTRQQWIASLEQDIHTLEKQQQAMVKTLEHMKCDPSNPQALLNLKQELGEVEKRLTVAKETLHQSTH